MLRKIRFYLFCVLTLSICAGCTGGQQNAEANASEAAEEGGLDLPQLSMPTEGEDIAVMDTNMGTVKLRFFPQYAPKAVENFVTHARNGYYDGLIFHRVIKDFMIQGGDPLGNGTGGESIWGGTFEYELTPSLRHFRGALAMAHSQMPDSNGSQFYIVQNDSLQEEYKTAYKGLLSQQDEVGYTGEDGAEMLVKEMYPTALLNKYIEEGGTPSLDGGYTVFGQVIEGMDVVDKIANTKTGENDKPNTDIVINSIVIEPYVKK